MSEATLLAYDRWALHLWRDYIESIGWPQEESRVIAHVLGVKRMWAARVRGEVPRQVPEVPLSSDEIESSHREWQEITQRNLDEVIQFRRFNGEAVESSLRDLALHVANHGTYHRGELRGLCHASGRGGFPETDFFVWDRLGKP